MKKLLALAVAIGWIASSPVSTAAGQKKWTVPRTVNGQPDLQGIWDFRSATPLERPKQFADREFMSADEVIAYEQRALEREDGRPPR